MTHYRTPDGPVRSVRRRVVGTRDELTESLTGWAETGVLVAYSGPITVVNDPGRMAVDVDLLVPAVPTSRPRRTPDVGTSRYADVGTSPNAHTRSDVQRYTSRPTDVRTSAYLRMRPRWSVRKVVAVSVTVAALVGALLWLLVWALVQVLTFAVTTVLPIVGGFVVICVVFGFLSSLGSGGGSGHCPGPWHR